MPNLTTTQWLGVVLLVVGVIWFCLPPLLAWIAARRRQTPQVASDNAEALADRMGRLAQLQTDLEARGHQEQAELAGEWYSLLRDPIEQQENASP